MVAPSGYVADPRIVERGLACLRAQGFQPGCIEAAQRPPYLRFAGTDEARAADINRLADARVPLPTIALALRGGYGAQRLLGQLDYDGLRERLAGARPIFTGHSDFTAIQLALLARSGVSSFAGPMLSSDFGAPQPNAFTMARFHEAVQGGTLRFDGLHPGHIENFDNVSGVLWGGNLAVLTGLIGTPYMPAIDGGILFVEDVNEHPFRIERMLYQLQLSGILGRQRALIFGEFSQYRLSDYDNGFSFDTMLAHWRATLNLPVLTGLRFGHTPELLTLPVGLPAELRGRKADCVLSVTLPHC
ncbi:MAG: LD-carboxypeptidase [Janthinobacterium lividum]